jgi:hypothetical protein
MVVTKDKEVLLDYKTGLHDSKYQKQLEITNRQLN